MSAIRVLVADDQALARDGLRTILEAREDIEVVAEANDGEEAIEQCLKLQPDVVLMDIRMPHLDGLQATRRLLERPGMRPPIVMLTTFDQDENVYEALRRGGASGFLLKDAPREQLVAGVRAAAAGDPPRSRADSSSNTSAAQRPARPHQRCSPNSPRANSKSCVSSRAGSRCRDRNVRVSRRGDRQDAHQPHPRQAQPPRPHASRHRRVRNRTRATRRHHTIN